MSEPDDITLACNGSKGANTPRLCLTEHLEVVERPGGGSYFFNRMAFSPVRTDGSPEAVRAFLKDHKEAIAELPEDLVGFLSTHRIVLPQDGNNNGNNTDPAEWSQAKWCTVLQNAPFVIRMPTRVSSMDRVQTAFRKVLSYLRSKSASKQLPPLNIKFLWNGMYPGRPLSDVGSLIRFAMNELQSLDAADFWLELPIERVVQWVQRLRLATVPPLGITCTFTSEPPKEQIAALYDLVGVGFRPHCVFYITSENLTQVRRTIDCLATRLGRDGFSFAIMPAPRHMFASDHIHQRLLPSVEELVDLLRYCHRHEGLELRQSWIYTDLTRDTILDAFQRFVAEMKKYYVFKLQSVPRSQIKRMISVFAQFKVAAQLLRELGQVKHLIKLATTYDRQEMTFLQDRNGAPFEAYCPRRMSDDLRRAGESWLVNEKSPFGSFLSEQEVRVYKYFSGKLSVAQIADRVAADGSQAGSAVQSRDQIIETVRDVYKKSEDGLNAVLCTF